MCSDADELHPTETLQVTTPIATDAISSDTPAIDGGHKRAQTFVGARSLVTDVYPMRSPAQFPGVLNDNIIARGAPTKLVSDRAQVEISKRVQGALRALCIDNWQSEPHTNARALPNDDAKTSSVSATLSWIDQGPLPTAGCCVSCMFVLS